MTDEQYHASLRIGSSGLKLMRKSAFHYWDEYVNPKRVKTETTALRFGRAFHTYLFEKESFTEKVVLEPSHWPTKAECGTSIEEQKREWAKTNARKTIISLDEFEQTKAMETSIRQHPAARMLLRQGVAEQVHLYDHPLTGSPSKIKPDWDSVEFNGLLVDAKTTEDASPEAVARSVVKYGYDIQGAWYMDGYLAANGVMPSGFVFIFVEKKRPYSVAVYYMPPEVIILGRQKYEPLLELFEECRQTGIWPAYSDTIQPITLPRWAFTQTR
jgi:exodeoxyribonuclease VIII